MADKEVASILITEWLAFWGGKWTKRVAQNMQPVRNLHDAFIEIIKYGSKIFTEPEVDKKAKLKTDTKIYAGDLYQIFDSMKGLRIFERFGFNLPAGCRKKPTGARVIH